MPALVSVIIPVWNLWDMTRACLASLAAHTPRGLFDVHVVDNGSTDATAQELEPLGATLFGDRFHAHRFESNYGFALASNEGARRASGDYLFFLNNDTLLLPHWLPPLLDGIITPPDTTPTAGVGPLLLYDGMDRVQHYGVAFSLGGVHHLYAHFPADHPAVNRPRRFQAMTAAALLMPRKVFMALGLFHEGYKNGFEDLDLCCQATRAGYTWRAVPQSRIVHRESSTPGRKAHDPANAALFSARCAGLTRPDLHLLPREDGFVPHLTAVLEPGISLPPEQEAALNREAKALTDIAALWERLRTYPLWQGGYERLRVALHAAGRHGDALMVSVLQCRFFSTPRTLAALEQTARDAGEPHLAALANDDRLQMERTLAAPDALRDKAARLSRHARRGGDRALETLYLDWLGDTAKTDAC